MPKFAYIAQDENQQQRKGVVEAPSNDEAIAVLQNKGWLILSIEEGETSESASRWTLLPPKIGDRDLIVFTRDFAALLNGGVPVSRALAILIRHSANPVMRKALERMQKEVAAGKSLSWAMEADPEAFPDFLAQMVMAGETGGSLVKMLRQVSDYFSFDEEIKKKVKNAMVYPVLVVVFALGLVDFISIKVVPTFAAIFRDYKLKLPALTRGVVGVSDFLNGHQAAVLAALGAVFFAAKMFFNTPSGRLAASRLKREAPVFRQMFYDRAMEQFFTALAMMLQSGVPMMNCFETMKKIFSDDPYYARAVDVISQEVVRGQPLSPSFRKAGIFSEMAVDSIAVGEEVGNLSQNLENMGRMHRENLDEFSKQLATLLEPFMIVIVGALVGAIMFALFIPMLDLMNVKYV